MKREYRGIIFTDHALNRLHNRNVSQQKAHQTLKSPQRKQPGKTSGSFKFSRDFDDYLLQLIAKKNNQNQWIILTCWVKDKSSRRQTKERNFLDQLLGRFLSHAK